MDMELTVPCQAVCWSNWSRWSVAVDVAVAGPTVAGCLSECQCSSFVAIVLSYYCLFSAEMLQNDCGPVVSVCTIWSIITSCLSLFFLYAVVFQRSESRGVG